MKKTLSLVVVTCCLLFNLQGFSQSDSVYYFQNFKLASDIQIIRISDKIGFRENYTHFKHAYWLVSIDTVLLADLNSAAKNKRNRGVYETYHECDSIINHIRNRATFHASSSRINDYANKEIGDNNIDFKSFKKQEDAKLQNLSEYCSDNFNELIENAESLQKKIIEELKNNKVEFYNYLESNKNSIQADVISDFLLTFNECGTDFKSIELIILNNPQAFVKLVNQMTEKSFNDLVSKLDFLPTYIDDKSIKKLLKKTGEQTLRTKTLRKTIKSRKWID
ncbi:MAG: hypothetical protein AB8B72_10735 [Crocinitomicaceae bacterium]